MLTVACRSTGEMPRCGGDRPTGPLTSGLEERNLRIEMCGTLRGANKKTTSLEYVISEIFISALLFELIFNFSSHYILQAYETRVVFLCSWHEPLCLPFG